MTTLKASARQRLAASAALLAPLLTLTACNADSDVEATGVGMDATAVVSGSGGAFAQENATEPATEDVVATDDMPADDDAGWEPVAVVPASSVGMETPLAAYEAFLVSIASWDNAAACSLITTDFVAEMSQETAQENITEDGAATDGTAGCVQSLDATLAWFDLAQVRGQWETYQVIGADDDFQAELGEAADERSSIRIKPASLNFTGGYDATRQIGAVDIDYTDNVGWQVAGLA